MTTTTLEKELITLEKKFWDALIHKDSETVQELTAKQSIVTGAQGVAMLTREGLAGMVGEPSWSLESYKMDDNFQVLPMSKDSAIVAYKVTEHMKVDGKPLTLEANDSSVWIKQDGHWVCALHTESVAGDPFGRDRQKS